MLWWRWVDLTGVGWRCGRFLEADEHPSDSRCAGWILPIRALKQPIRALRTALPLSPSDWRGHVLRSYVCVPYVLAQFDYFAIHNFAFVISVRSFSFVSSSFHSSIFLRSVPHIQEGWLVELTLDVRSC